MNLIYLQMMVFCLKWLYFDAIVCPFTQMNAYFLVREQQKVSFVK